MLKRVVRTLEKVPSWDQSALGGGWSLSESVRLFPVPVETGQVTHWKVSLRVGKVLAENHFFSSTEWITLFFSFDLGKSEPPRKKHVHSRRKLHCKWWCGTVNEGQYQHGVLVPHRGSMNEFLLCNHYARWLAAEDVISLDSWRHFGNFLSKARASRNLVLQFK